MIRRPTLTTARLVLRPFVLTDADEVERLAGARAIADTTAAIPHPYPPGEASRWIDTHQPRYEAGQLIAFAMTLKGSDRLVGCISLMDVSAYHERAEIGFWVGQPYWNRGYCTEAARAVLAYGFSVTNLNRIFGYCLTRNPASGRVMEKVGMSREGCLRAHVKKWETLEDIVVYGVLRGEWRPGRVQVGDDSSGGSGADRGR